jgi:hypothetical protein
MVRLALVAGPVAWVIAGLASSLACDKKSVQDVLFTNESIRTNPSHKFPMSLCFGRVVEEMPILELQTMLSDGRLTSRTLMECYMNRIVQVDPYIR